MEYLKVRPDFQDLLTVLSEAETGRLFLAMLQYAAVGKEPENLSGNERFVWPSGKREMDTIAMNDQRMRQLGALGGKAKAHARQQLNCSNNADFIVPDVSAANDSHSDARDPLSIGRNPMCSSAEDPLSVGRIEKEKGKENEEEKERSKEKEEDIKRDNDKYLFLHQAFERFWAAYPRHENKEAAWNIFRRLNPDAALLETMLKSVELSKQSDQWRQDSGKYIPYPANWLKQRRWEDEPPKVSPGPVGKTVTAQEYSQRDYAPRRDRAMESFLAAVARMEAEEAMENRTEEEEGA